MKQLVANKKPNNQIFVKFDDIDDFLTNIENVQWNGRCKYCRDLHNTYLKIFSYEGWTEFDPKKHYLSNSDFECYYPVSTEYFEANYEIGEK